MAESLLNAIQNDLLAVIVCLAGFALTWLIDYKNKQKRYLGKLSPVSAAKARPARAAACTDNCSSEPSLSRADAKDLAEVARLAAEGSAQDVISFYDARLASCDLGSAVATVRLLVQASLQRDRIDIIESIVARPCCTQSIGAALRELAQGGTQEQLDRVLRALPTKKAFHYNTALDAIASRGDLAAAESLLKRAAAAGGADVVTYNTMIKALAQRGHLQRALELVSSMRGDGVAPNSVTFNQIVDACTRKSLASAWGAVEIMNEAGVKPSYVTASIIVKVLQPTTSTADVDRAFKLLDAVEGDMDEVALGSVLEAGIRMKRPDVIKRFLRMQHAAKIPVQSCHTYGSMVRAHGVVNDLEGVWRVWNELLERNIPWTCITLGNMVEALVINGQTDAAYRIVVDAASDPSKKEALTSVTFGSLIKGFAQQKRYTEVWTVYNEMKRVGLQPSLVTLNTLVNACVQCRRMDQISLILEEISGQGITPDIITYSSIIKGYCQEGRLDQAFQVLDTVNRSTVPLRPDEFTYNSLIDGCARACQFDRGLAVLDNMKKAGIPPSNFTLSVLVKLAGRCKKLDKAFDLCEEITKHYGFAMNVHVYNNLIQACLNNCSWGLRKALSVVKDMVVGNIRPDKRTYKLLLDASLQARDARLTCELIRGLVGLPGALASLGDLSPVALRPQGALDFNLAYSNLDDLAGILRGRDVDGVFGSLLLDLRRLPGFRIDARHTPSLAAWAGV